ICQGRHPDAAGYSWRAVHQAAHRAVHLRAVGREPDAVRDQDEWRAVPDLRERAGDSLSALGAGVVPWQPAARRDQHLQGDQTALIDAGVILLPQSRNVPDLKMVDQDGQPVSLGSLKDKWTLLFFGYTFCPDI
nr:hypothetical protein [Tanacetum cinerariifolium]